MPARSTAALLKKIDIRWGQDASKQLERACPDFLRRLVDSRLTKIIWADTKNALDYSREQRNSTTALKQEEFQEADVKGAIDFLIKTSSPEAAPHLEQALLPQGLQPSTSHDTAYDVAYNAGDHEYDQRTSTTRSSTAETVIYDVGAKKRKTTAGVCHTEDEPVSSRLRTASERPRTLPFVAENKPKPRIKRTIKAQPKRQSPPPLNQVIHEDGFEPEDTKTREVAKILRNERNIVFIVGAGISMAADVPGFEAIRGEYGSDALTLSQITAKPDVFKNMVQKLAEVADKAEPTKFHQLIDRIAVEGRLLRLYTQNIDDIESKLGSLKTGVMDENPRPNTIQLHGNIHHGYCSLCSKLSRVAWARLEDWEHSKVPCGFCEKNETERQEKNSGCRVHPVGTLAPRVGLYEGIQHDQSMINCAINQDVKAKPNAVIVVGTRLSVLGAERLVKFMCTATKERGGIAVWINPTEPTKRMKPFFNIILLRKCDDVANAVDQLDQEANEVNP